MKQVVIKLIAPLLCLIGLWSCSDDEPSLSPDNKQWTEKVVAVVLPMEKGLDVHWKRTLGMFTTNFERAFKNHEAGIRNTTMRQRPMCGNLPGRWHSTTRCMP